MAFSIKTNLTNLPPKFLYIMHFSNFNGFFSTHCIALFANLFLPLPFYSRKSFLKSKVLLKLLSKFDYCFLNSEMGFKFQNLKSWFKFCNSFSEIRHFSKPFKSNFLVLKIVVKCKTKKVWSSFKKRSTWKWMKNWICSNCFVCVCTKTTILIIIISGIWKISDSKLLTFYEMANIDWNLD